MTEVLPFEAHVPDGWESVAPESVGVPNATLVLVDRRDGGEFAANITVSVTARADADVRRMADESLDRLRAAAQDVVVVERTEVGDAQAPGLAQVVRLRARSGHPAQLRELVQSQVHLVMRLAGRPDVVIELSLTCLPTQGERAVPDFQAFVSGFRVRQDDPPPDLPSS